MLGCIKDSLKAVGNCIWPTVIKAVGNCIWPFVKPNFDYWWCFDGNVQDLRIEILRLEMERSNMNHEIDKARLRAEIARPEFENWLNEGTPKLEEAKRILQGCDSAPPASHIKSRYLTGKSAKETAEGIARFRKEEKPTGEVASQAHPASAAQITHAPTLEFQSRKPIEDNILNFLKDGNVHMIAICGAGGVGKSIMVQRIADRAIKEKLFDEVVNVVVRQQTDMFIKKQVDMLKIQKQVAEILGLNFRKSEALGGRAHKLRTRLMDLKKKLIIFDDVWKSFRLEDIGVPYEGCKIILTSRHKNVCEEMDAKVIEIQVLEEEEAWRLFREKSGDCVDGSDMLPTAEKVAAECKCLPIALVTVGKALKNEKNINTWKDALLQLRTANPTNFPQVVEKVYMPLKLSYDFLEDQSEKDLFLLCSLFPEDYNIQIEDLALLSFGLGMFEEFHKIQDGRNRTHKLLGKLRSSFLLMSGGNDNEVKMHDVFRDVAIFIGSKDRILESLQVLRKDLSHYCNWMSVDISNSNAKLELPVKLDFPNLLLLMILNIKSHFESHKEFYVNDICFKRMEKLRVLYFSNQNFQLLLPSSLKNLKNLRKLHLHRCEVKDISVVGELTSLEFLCVRFCNEIEELPSDVGKLKILRLLELRDCEKLERIAASVISSLLVGLEELKIVGCFIKWESKGNLSEERNASLSELECLHNLTSLEIDIFDTNLVAQEILLSKHFKKHQIRPYKDRFVFEGKNHEV